MACASLVRIERCGLTVLSTPSSDAPDVPDPKPRTWRRGSAAADRGEHLRRMIGRARHAGPVLLDLAVGADPHRRTDDALDLLAVHHLLAEGAIGGHHLLR